MKSKKKILKEFEEIGFGNQSRIVGTKRVDLKDWLEKALDQAEQGGDEYSALTELCSKAFNSYKIAKGYSQIMKDKQDKDFFNDFKNLMSYLSVFSKQTKMKSKKDISQKIHGLSYKHDNEIMLAHDDLMELIDQAERMREDAETLLTKK